MTADEDLSLTVLTLPRPGDRRVMTMDQLGLTALLAPVFRQPERCLDYWRARSGTVIAVPRGTTHLALLRRQRRFSPCVPKPV